MVYACCCLLFFFFRCRCCCCSFYQIVGKQSKIISNSNENFSVDFQSICFSFSFNLFSPLFLFHSHSFFVSCCIFMPEHSIHIYNYFVLCNNIVLMHKCFSFLFFHFYQFTLCVKFTAKLKA